MPLVRTELHGAKGLLQEFSGGITRRFLVLAKRVVDARFDGIISAIRKGEDYYFDEPTGELAQGLWADEARRLGYVVKAEGGWAHPHGPVREWGPSVSSWEIYPKAAKALRFFKTYGKYTPGGDPGAIVYAKKVTHEWDPKELRPHWGPEIMKQEPALHRDLADAMEAAVRGRRR